MTSWQKPDVIITHESDLDGFLSGLLLQRLASIMFGETPRLEAWNNLAWPTRQLRERVMWVSDMTFEKRLDQSGWLIVDHHQFAKPPSQATLIHDANKSASLLAYELCKSNSISSPVLDRLVHLSNVADLFLTDDPDFDLACDYANLVKTYGFWPLHQLIEGEPERLLDHPLLKVIKVKREIEDPIGYAWSKQHIQKITAELGYVETVVGNTNLIVHKLIDDPQVPYSTLVTIYRRSNGVVLVSLRSSTGDAIKIADRLKGGGHPNAAGASLPRSVANVQDGVDYLRRFLNPESNPGNNLNIMGSAFDGLKL